MSVYVEFARETDLSALFTHFADWYRFNPRMQERDYFDWQFRDGPVRLSNAEYDFLILRDDDGGICGCLGGVGFRFQLGEETRTGVWSHNWVSEKKNEGGLLLFSRFLELADNRILIRLNEISGAITRLYRMPMLDIMPRWWGVLDAGQVAELFAFTDIDDLKVLAGSQDELARNLRSPRFSTVDRLDADEEFGFEHLGGVQGWVRRDGRYINWRYRDIPHHNYRILHGGNAFAVFRVETIMHTNAQVIRLLEWTFGVRETPAALASVIEAAGAPNPILLDFHCTSARIGAGLVGAGFRPQAATRKSMPDMFRPANYSGGYPVAIDLPPHRTQRRIDFSSWYITSGDSDVDRVKL